MAVIVLAAGASQRFGSPKLLQELGGVSLLRGRIEVARQVAGAGVYVVLGPGADQLAPECADTMIVRNPAWRAGMGGSIAAGVRALPESVTDVLLVLADQVALTARDLQALLRVHPDSDGITCARYGTLPGVPALFSRRWFTALEALSGEHGARELLRLHAHVRAVDLPAAAVDIDTPEELESYRASISRH